MPAMEAIVAELNNKFKAGEVERRDPGVLRRFSLARAASMFGIVVEGSPEQRFIARWPRAQQDAVRGVLLGAIRRRKPVTFDWAEAATYQMTVEELADRIPLNFRSPIVRLRR